ncbi:MAG: flagellar biosynthesis protein FlhF [Chromatiales bacterium]|nr:flagellar biosynthesis protein FlhF [Chromatiales bacterium]
MDTMSFNGNSMREALRRVRDELGPEAVIMDTRHDSGAVEIIAARPGSVPIPGAGADTDCFRIDDSEPAVELPGDTGKDSVSRLQQEVGSLRCLLESQLARLIWDERSRCSPELASALRKCGQLGIDSDIARKLAGSAMAGNGSWRALLPELVRALAVSEPAPGTGAGIVAICGPTGVGKTTTIAKLAARQALREGPDTVGLITMDSYRVAAREQLENYGRILGVSVQQVSSAEGLSHALDRLASRKLVLIDTAGMGQRDPRLREQLAWLEAAGRPIDTLLALPANVQGGTLRQIITQFAGARPAAAILTKVDEATSLGPALSAVIREQLPLAWVTNGQRVPEDLQRMHGRESWLIKLAVEMVRDDPAPPDEQALAWAYTREVQHAWA